MNDAVCIRVSGADAYEFLRAQLATDPPPLGAPENAAAPRDAKAEAAPDVEAGPVMANTNAGTDADRGGLTAWLDARGRVRALFRVVALDHDYVLLAERETAAAVLAKLRMFVLRSRVVLAIDEDWQAAAIVGQSAAVDGCAEGVASGAGLHWLRAAPELLYALGPQARIAELATGFEPAEPGLVELAEIRLGLPRLGAALTERYVPQMLNLDLLGAVAFDKGCYPGQEVVARLKYRGDVKRRARRFAAPAAALPAPGDEVVDAAGTSAGEVVRAAPSGSGGIELLAVVQLEAAAGKLRLAADPNGALEPLPLPFEADVISSRA